MRKTICTCDICGAEVPATHRVNLSYIGDAFRNVVVNGREQDPETLSYMFDLCPECMAHGVVFKYGDTPDQVLLIGKAAGRCASCYYYQTAYDDHSRPAGMACFAEHLRASVGGLDVEDEAEAWAQVGPDDYCSKWTAKKFRAKVAGKGEGLDACGQI